MTDQLVSIADDGNNDYENNFRTFERIIQSSEDMLFGPKVDAICSKLEQTVDYLLTESVNHSVDQPLATHCLRSIGASVGLPNGHKRCDLAINERISKFFEICLKHMFDRNTKNRWSVQRMATSLAALLSEADISGLAMNLIEKISQQLVEVIKNIELDVNEKTDIGDTAYVVKCLTEIASECFQREPAEDFADHFHLNWIEHDFCHKRLMKTVRLLNDIYSDIEWTAIHSASMPVYNDLLLGLQLELKKFCDKFKVYSVRHMAINYRD